MKNNVDMLVVLNIFGHHKNEQRQIENYKESLKGIFRQIENAKENTFRVVVAACMVSDTCIKELKKEYGEEIHIFRYSDRYTCQVTSNSTILKSIEHFNEEYEGYLYYSSGIHFAEESEHIQSVPLIDERGVRIPARSRVGNPKLFETLAEKIKTGKYGIVQLQVNLDHGYHFLGHGPYEWSNRIDFMKDYDVPMGNHANFHIAAIHKSLKEFYEKPISDVHGFCGMESTLSYCCAALKKKYILMGDSLVMHQQKFDNDFSSPGRMLNTAGVPVIGQSGSPCSNLLWGRDKAAISRDPEAIETGLGYYPGPAAGNEPDWNGIQLVHDVEKYDDEYFSLDDKMKNAVKRLFFTNKDEIEYKDIQCEIV